MNPESMNESEDPKSMRDINGVSGINLEVTGNQPGGDQESTWR